MLKFYAVESGRHDDWQIRFVLATSLEDAGERYVKSVKKEFDTWFSSEYYKGTTITAKVYETDFDEFGVLKRIFNLSDEKPTLTIQVPN